MPEIDIGKLHIDKAKILSKKRRKKGVYLLLLLALLLAAATVLYRKGLLSPGVAVDVATVQTIYPSQTLTLLNASGYVVAQRKAAVASKTTGRLVALSVEEGDRVEKDQVIARLENEDVRATVARARANATLAQAMREQAEAELADALLSYTRYRTLIAKGIIARAVFDAAETRYRKAQAEVAAQEAAVHASAAAVQEAEVMLSYSYIKAPFDGVVLTKNADIGDIITPLGAAANAKAAVVTIADLNSLQVEVDVSEANIVEVKKGQPCEIRLDALPDTRLRGRVHMIVPTADRSKAAVMVKIAFVESSPQVLPEMSAKVAFLSREVLPEERNSLKAIPAEAIATRDGKTFVFVVRSGRASETPLKTGRRLNAMVEILAGLKEGDLVAISPLHKLKDGIKVKVPEK